eukprot:gene968-983_t
MTGCADVSALTNADDEALLKFIQDRYNQEQNGWETWCGSDVLVIVNPYTKSSVKNDEDIWAALRRCGMNYIGAPPHPYTMAAKAVQRMMRQNSPVFCIISGESGTGKTHSARLMMEYVVQCCSRSSGSNQQPTMPETRVINPWLSSVLCTNPMLEAFGNAATTRNNNSSRFGKITKMHLDFPERHYFRVAAAQLRKVEVSTVLLGTTRLTNLPADDRSFHILHGTKKVFQTMWDEVGKDFPFLTPVRDLCLDLAGTCLGNAPEPNVENDRGTHTPEGWFIYVATHLQEIGVSTDKIENIFRSIMGCCYLLDVEFEIDQDAGSGKSMITPSTSLYFQRAAELLRMDARELETELLYKRKKSPTGGDDIIINNAPAQSKSYASSLARSVYNLVFHTVVENINQHLANLAPEQEVDNSGRTMYSQSIGIVDIYGFEQFQQNGFEQLLINYFNEHQHQLFMHEMIRAEKIEYAAEQVVVPPDVMAQLEANPDEIADNRIAGLNASFQVLSSVTKDVVTARAKLKADGLQLLEMMDKVSKNSATNVNVRNQQRDANADIIQEFTNTKPSRGRSFLAGEESFAVTHYANKVEYHLAEFVESNKNDDVVATSMRALSGIDFINCGLQRDNATSAAKLSDPTSFVANRFLNEINNYRKLLDGAGQLFVRCVGPNPQKGSIVVSLPHVQRQLNCMGLFHATTIRARGYPTRICYTEVYDRIVGLMSREFREMMLSLGDGAGDRVCNAQIFVRVLVEALALPEFRTCFVSTIESAFGQSVIWSEENCEVQVGIDVVFGKQKLFCRPGKSVAFEYIKILSEQYPDQTMALAEMINRFVSVERIRQVREENVKKLMNILDKKLTEINEYSQYLQQSALVQLTWNKIAKRAVERRTSELCSMAYDEWYTGSMNQKQERENEARENLAMAEAEAEERARMFKEKELEKEARECSCMSECEAEMREFLRLEAEELERQRLEAERLERERLEAERIERERLE